MYASFVSNPQLRRTSKVQSTIDGGISETANISNKFSLPLMAGNLIVLRMISMNFSSIASPPYVPLTVSDFRPCLHAQGTGKSKRF